MLNWIQRNSEWIFSGVGVAVISGIIVWLRARRTHSKQNSDTPTVVSVGSGSIISGNVAGRDVTVISSDQTKPRLDELARICEQRAAAIQRDLQQHYEYTSIQDWLGEFMILHKRHVEALRAGRVIESHEILIEIHKHSYNLEIREASNRLAKHSRPGVDYAMSSGWGERGPMISGYVTGDIKRNSDKYPVTVEYMTYRFDSHRHPTDEEARNLYRRAFRVEI